jgi:hypothetical protein
MAAKLNTSDNGDPSLLLSGDLVGFQIEMLGYMCTPSTFEPIPEYEEVVSHLRVSAAHKKSSTADYRRCMFKIENNDTEVSIFCSVYVDFTLCFVTLRRCSVVFVQASNIVFGQNVKISHYPSGAYLVASQAIDTGYAAEAKLRCVFLRSPKDIQPESFTHMWTILPKYKLREEGDAVRHNDYLVLRSAAHKHLYIAGFPVGGNKNAASGAANGKEVG